MLPFDALQLQCMGLIRTNMFGLTWGCMTWCDRAPSSCESAWVPHIPSVSLGIEASRTASDLECPTAWD